MIDTAHLSAGDLAQEYLWRPMVLFFEPILLVYNTYLALIYGVSPSQQVVWADDQDCSISGSNLSH